MKVHCLKSEIGGTMKRILLIILAALLFFGAVFLFLTIRYRINRPYEDEGVKGPNHDGVFLSEHGKMVFNGDGKSLTFDFDEVLCALTGLPAGEHSGTYAFLSADLPPHGKVRVHYETAMLLEIALDEDTKALIDLGIASKDGKSAASGKGIVRTDLIPFLFTDENGSFSILFEKESGS